MRGGGGGRCGGVGGREGGSSAPSLIAPSSLRTDITVLAE